MTANRHCLLIGINEYPNVVGANLKGCTNDVALIGTLLTDRFGFPEDDCIVLRDGEASQAAIRAAFAKIERRVEKDDLVVCFYAGHGSRIADPLREGAMIESIVPHDSGRGEKPNRDLYDVEIDRWVQRLNARTPYVTLIFDCCHSGSVTRDPFGEATREIPIDLRSPAEMFERGIVPEILKAPRIRSADQPGYRAGYVAGRRRAVTLAACRADELANEYLAREYGTAYRHGALSYFLGRALREAGPGRTWRDLFERLGPALNAAYRRQHPQLEGKIDELLFGTGQVRPASYLKVGSTGDGAVELVGGAAHGVTAGSVWSIRSAAARSLGDGDEIAAVQVESVGTRTSRARPVAGSEPGQPPGEGRAFLRHQQLPEPGLRVALSAPEQKARESARLAALVADSKLLRPAGGDEPADVLVHGLAPRDAVGPGDPCPGLGPLAQWTWAAVGRDGRLALGLRPEPADLPALVADLVRLARFRHLLEIDNPDRASRLRGRVRLRVKRRQGTEAGAPRFVAAKPEPGDGVVVLPEGEAVEIEVENAYDLPVWVTVVQFGTDGAVELLMPRPGHATYRMDDGEAGIRLEPGELRSVREYYLGDPEFAPAVADGLPLHLPDGFPWAAEPGESADVGFIHLKLLVTLEDTDFEFLQQESVRFDPTHPLQQLALVYHSGEGSRSILPKKTAPSPEMDWTTVTVALGIRGQDHGISRL